MRDLWSNGMVLALSHETLKTRHPLDTSKYSTCRDWRKMKEKENRDKLSLLSSLLWTYHWFLYESQETLSHVHQMLNHKIVESLESYHKAGLISLRTEQLCVGLRKKWNIFALIFDILNCLWRETASSSVVRDQGRRK